MNSGLKKLKSVGCGLALVVASMVATINSAYAGDFTARADIVSVRSYLNGAYFVTISGNGALKNGIACTTVYKVPAAAAGAKTLVATLLTAKAAGNQVELEVATGCPAPKWGQDIISVVLF